MGKRDWQVKKPKQIRGRGRPKRRYVDFELAKYIARRAGVRSRRQYWEWWEREGNDGMPKMPYRVYKDEWQGWNDFLGTRNTFEPRRFVTSRPFWEAVRWSQQICREHNIDNQSKWLQFYDDNKDTLIPKDIPKRPETVYDEWQGWPVWLGKNLEGKIMSAQKGAGFIALVVEHMNPKNMITVLKWTDGYYNFVEYVKQQQLYVIKLYTNEEGAEQLIRRTMDTYGSSQSGNVWIVANVNHILFELDTNLEWYQPPKKKEYKKQ